jgi:ABC-2 type transport system permease protein
MTAFWALIRKQVVDARWTLGFSAAALFGLSWLFVYATSRIEERMRAVAALGGAARPMRMLRGLGGESMDFTSPAIEMAFWNHPFIVLTFAIWVIGRGSAAVAAEVERGTMDLILSRPVSRTRYLAAQVTVALTGLAVLAGAMILGNWLATRYNPIQDPPSLALLLKPSANLAALGLSIYGYTLLCSTLDSVRWRPTLIASVVTLAGFIANVVANLPTLEDWKWLEKLSIFKAFDPVEVVTKGQTLAFNLAILSGLGVAGVVLAFLAFSVRDLPSNA